MHLPLGKPILGLLSAACITVPAGVPQAGAAEFCTPLSGVSSHASADDAWFDPVPPAVRLITETPVSAQAGTAGIGNPTALALADNPLVLALDLLTLPYHNLYGIGSAAGSAFADILMAAALPISIASLILVNEEDKIPAYADTVLTNLRGAIPGIVTAINNEITYDISLFQQLGGMLDASRPEQTAPDSGDTDFAETPALAADDPVSATATSTPVVVQTAADLADTLESTDAGADPITAVANGIDAVELEDGEVLLAERGTAGSIPDTPGDTAADPIDLNATVDAAEPEPAPQHDEDAEETTDLIDDLEEFEEAEPGVDNSDVDDSDTADSNFDAPNIDDSDTDNSDTDRADADGSEDSAEDTETQ